MTILAIDPGPVESAAVVIRKGIVTDARILPNEELLLAIHRQAQNRAYDAIVIEQIASMGMAVGAEVFATCQYTGRLWEAARPLPVHFLPRSAVKMAICGHPRAKDGNIRQALIDRFGGPAAKKKGGVLHGFRKDLWQALAVGLAWLDGEVKP